MSTRLGRGHSLAGQGRPHPPPSGQKKIPGAIVFLVAGARNNLQANKPVQFDFEIRL